MFANTKQAHEGGETKKGCIYGLNVAVIMMIIINGFLIPRNAIVKKG